MKKLLSPLLVLVLAACSSSGNKETALQDSVAIPIAIGIDTIAVTTEGPPVEIFEEQVSDTSQLEITYDETAGLVFERQEPYYTVTIVTKQYEASSDVTWYFDDYFSPLYFKETWAAEGNEGYTEFFFEAGTVMCASSQDGSDEKKWCRKTGGLRIYDGGSGDLLSELLPSEYDKECDSALAQYLETLSAIIREGVITQKDGDSYTLRIEKTVDVGMEVKEETEIVIPKPIYNSFIGEY